MRVKNADHFWIWWGTVAWWGCFRNSRHGFFFRPQPNPIHWIFLKKHGLIINSNADLWAPMGKNCQQIVLCPKISTIFSKILCLHPCYFFCVCDGGTVWHCWVTNCNSFSFLDKHEVIFCLTHPHFSYPHSLIGLTFLPWLGKYWQVFKGFIS